MNRLLALVAVALLAGCDCDCPYKSYKLSSGEIVECKRKFTGECGVKLSECKDGIVYRCLTNVRELPTPTTSPRSAR